MQTYSILKDLTREIVISRTDKYHLPVRYLFDRMNYIQTIPPKVIHGQNLLVVKPGNYFHAIVSW